MVWNDMQWYSYSLPFLLMQTFWMDTHWMDPYWWDTCWRYVLVGYVLVGYVCDSCWCTPFEWIRIEWIRIAWIRIGGIRVERIRIGGIRIGGIRIAKPADANALNGYALHGYVLVGYVLNGYVLVGYVLVGYVLVGYVLNGYVWDMCGVMDMCGICVVWDMCGICVVWDTPTIFWRTLRRNVFREKTKQKKHPPPTMQDGPVKGPGSLHRWHWDPKKQLHSLYLKTTPHTSWKKTCSWMDWCLDVRWCFSGFQATKRTLTAQKFGNFLPSGVNAFCLNKGTRQIAKLENFSPNNLLKNPATKRLSGKNKTKKTSPPNYARWSCKGTGLTSSLNM